MKEEVESDESPLRAFLASPLIFLSFFTAVYLVYPQLWNKAVIVEASKRMNEEKLVENCNDLAGYVSYRKGLYVNVRSNFG